MAEPVAREYRGCCDVVGLKIKQAVVSNVRLQIAIRRTVVREIARGALIVVVAGYVFGAEAGNTVLRTGKKSLLAPGRGEKEKEC